MKILVCLKQVPDTTEVKLSSSYTMERDFIAQVINPADESALELAFKLRDQHGGEVTVLTMGPARVETMLREAVARGADHAVQMTDNAFAGADTLVTAQCLFEAAKHLGGFDLILCGRRATDGETGQVGPMLAAMAGMACVPNATNASVEGDACTIEQLTEAGVIVWTGRLPVLVTMCEWSHRLRLPTMMGLKKARNAEITLLTASDLGITHCGLKASPTRVVHISAKPSGVRPCRKMAVEDVLCELTEKGVLA